jgi:selenocysteine lyase/cysteine desulfurase
MGVTRKQLLVGGAALALAGCAGKQAQFELDPDEHHFDAFLFASHPRVVREAIERHRRGLDAGAARYVHEHQEELDSAVAAAGAAYLGVRADQLAFTDSTTMGLALVYQGLRLDGEVLTTEHDFYSTYESLRLRGAKVRRVRLYDDPAQATAERMIGALRDAIRPETNVLAVTRVHSGTGVQLPLAQLGQVAPLVVVDGVHALAAVEHPLAGADVFVAGTHKWLGGPRGTGLIYARAWDALEPVIPNFTPDRFTPGGYHSFEHRWALAEAFKWQSGLRGVPQRIAALATRLKDGLAGMSHVRLITPRDPRISAGLVCFEVDGMAPATVVARLARHRVRASVTPYATPYARLGTSLHTDEHDVDAALNAVDSLRG